MHSDHVASLVLKTTQHCLELVWLKTVLSVWGKTEPTPPKVKACRFMIGHFLPRIVSKRRRKTSQSILVVHRRSSWVIDCGDWVGAIGVDDDLTLDSASPPFWRVSSSTVPGLDCGTGLGGRGAIEDPRGPISIASSPGRNSPRHVTASCRPLNWVTHAIAASIVTGLACSIIFTAIVDECKPCA